MKWVWWLALVPVAAASFTAAPGWSVELSDITDVDASVGRWSHASVSDGDTLYVIYHGNTQPSTVYVTARSLTTGAVATPVAVGRSGDDHGHPSIAMDSAGHLHVSFGGHVTPATPIVHRASVAPGDISAWTPPVAIERAANSAYTFLSIDDADTLHLLYRRAGATQIGHGDLVIRSRPAGGTWSAATVLIDHPSWSIYPSDLIVQGDRIDVAWHIRDFGVAIGMPGTLHSIDRGATWQDVNGAPLHLPARPEALPLLDDEVFANGWPAPQLARSGDELYAIHARGDILAAPQQIRASIARDGWVTEDVVESGLRSRSLAFLDGELSFLSISPDGRSVLFHQSGEDGWSSRTAFRWDGEGTLSRPAMDRGLSRQGDGIQAYHGFGVIIADGTVGQMYWISGPRDGPPVAEAAPFPAPLWILVVAYACKRASSSGSWSMRTSSTNSPT